MGDRCYARISIPTRFIANPDTKKAVAEILGKTEADIDHILAEKPHDDEATYDNGLSLCLVDGLPCLVWEYDQANYGAATEEEALVKAKVPYLLVHQDGGEYSAGSVVFDGRVRAEVELNRQDDIVAVVDTNGRRARLQPRQLANIDSYISTRRALLKPAAP